MDYTVTIDAHLLCEEPEDFLELQHALFDAASAAYRATAAGDALSGAFTSFDDNDLQVVVLVRAGNEDDAASAARRLVSQVLADEGVETVTVSVTASVEGRSPYDDLLDDFDTWSGHRSTSGAPVRESAVLCVDGDAVRDIFQCSVESSSAVFGPV